MKKFMKKAFAVLLALVMLSGTFVSFAAELNESAVKEHYGQFENYLLLGDSVASGYRDEMSENDKLANDKYHDSTYARYEGSYADVLADAIIADGSMTALAAPGFRTIEMRYMLEDDFAATCDDPYLFHPSHLYVYEEGRDTYLDGQHHLPGDEYFRELFKTSIKEADLITLGLGGNDWGAYLGWVVADVFEAENVADPYIAEVKEILDKSTMDVSTIETLVDLAHKAGALEELITTLPEALNYGLGNFYKNWNIVIEDIYELNPTVTLMVIGMSDNSLKGSYYDYDGVAGEPVETDTEEDATKAKAMSLIIDFIMGVGNGPMIEGASKYGYTYIDTDGTTYVDSHPDAAGHVYIANKIIEALPDPEISKKYTDIAGNKYYSAIEYVLLNGIMEGKTETEFKPDIAISKGEFHKALNVITGSDKSETSTDSISAATAAFSIIGCAGDMGGIEGFFKTIALGLKVISDCNFSFGTLITRAQAASYLSTLANI